jgi:hypothetical protein
MRLLQNWVDSFVFLTRNSEAADLFREWSAVSTVASALQRKCYLSWGPMTFYPNMYIVLTAPPGTRKGTAMEPAQEFLESLNIKLAAEAITREALIRELKNSNNTVIDPKNGTMELHSSLTVHSREFTVFIGYQNHALMSDLSDWYDCRKRWTYRTKNSGTDELIGVWVNIEGATTPELLKAAMPIDLIGSGLASRTIFVYETECRISPTPWYTQEDVELREKLLIDLKKIENMQGQFTVTEDFIEFWVKWYTEYRMGKLPFRDLKFSGYFQRRPTHAIKLACILNASRTDSMIVNSNDLRSGIKLLERTEVNMPRTFSGIGEGSHAALLAKVMAEIGNRKRMSFPELLNLFKDDADVKMLTNIVNIMDTTGYINYIRPSGIIEITDKPL